jgi:hypothetical protein
MKARAEARTWQTVTHNFTLHQTARSRCSLAAGERERSPQSHPVGDHAASRRGKQGGR